MTNRQLKPAFGDATAEPKPPLSEARRDVL